MIVVEALALNADDALAAQAAGVDRLEICSAFALGGLTPTLGTFQSIRAATSLPLIAMIRPRPSGFCYSNADFQAMLRDADLLLEAGADGLVFGILDEAGEIDVARCKAFVERAAPKPTVFHRAFDATPEPKMALETLIDLGVRRVLTTGHATSALQGAIEIRRLIELADGRIEVMAGGGVRENTAREILSISGANQVHLGPFVPHADPSVAPSDLTMRAFGATYPIVDAETLSVVVAILKAYN